MAMVELSVTELSVTETSGYNYIAHFRKISSGFVIPNIIIIGPINLNNQMFSMRVDMRITNVDKNKDARQHTSTKQCSLRMFS